MTERPRVITNSHRPPERSEPIEFVRIETATPLDAQGLWARLLYEKHPEISHIVLAYYRLGRQEDEFRRFDTQYLRSRGYLTELDYPRTHVDLSLYMCAISSIVGTSVSSGVAPKNSAHLNPDFVLPNPKSFIHLDLVTRSIPSPGILVRTIRNLQELPHDWYILCTGLSYHVIIDHLVDIDEFPWHWGSVIGRFTRSSLSKFERRKSWKYGQLLKAASGDPDLLLKVQRILHHDTTGYGYPESEENGRRPSPNYDLDWGHFYRTLSGLVSFCEGEGAGAGYLRICSKNQYPPPFVVAQKEGEIITQFDIPLSYYAEHIKPSRIYRRYKAPHAEFLWDPVDLEEALWVSGAVEEEITAFLAILGELDDLDKRYLLETGPLGIEAVLARRMGKLIDESIISLAEKLHEALKIL